MLDVQGPFDYAMDSLEQLADRISEVFECSVTIEDANHRLVAYSSHRPESDPARISTIVGRRVPERIIQTLWRDGIFQQIMNSESPVRVAAIEEIGLGERIVIAIRRDHSVLGYIWILEENGKLDEPALMQLQQAAKLAKAKLLQLQATRQKEEQGHQDFLWQLLTNHIKTDAEFRQAQEKYKLQLPPLFCINIIQFVSEIGDKLSQQIHYLIKTLLDKRVVLYTINQNQLILLENKTSDRFVAAGAAIVPTANVFTLLAESMKLRFGTAPIAGSCGLPYEHYSMVELSYQEALTVLRMKETFTEELASCYYYSELGYYRTLPMLQSDKSESHYRNSFFNKLAEYDMKHNGNLLPTLEAYLSHNCNMKTSADALHVHENTLSYRLKRIAEVSGIDLNSMDDKVTCYIDMKLKTYDGR